MSIREDIRPVTYLKNRTAELLDQVNETRRPVVITQNGKPKAVIQDPDTFEATQRAVGMLKLLLQGEEDVRKGNLRSQEDVFADLRKKVSKDVRSHGKRKYT